MIEYELISFHYKKRVASRSRVPLINHIDEGLVLLNALGATEKSKKAFCLHPLLQNDEDLILNYGMVALSSDAYTVLLAMEYRSVANEYLSDKTSTNIRLSPLDEVNDMLVADKVQNYKDFMRYHKNTHPRSEDLDVYFKRWLSVLGVDHSTYQHLCKLIGDQNE